MIQRYLNIQEKLKAGKTLLIMGPRRVGKTTLMCDFIDHTDKKVAVFDGTNLEIQRDFSQYSLSHLSKFVKGFEIVAIDEAQNISNIGMSLKIINDHLPEIAVLATGSSSFELNGQVGEPLVGRKTTAFLYPLALGEIIDDDNFIKNASEWTKWNSIKDTVLIYGMYPDVLTADNDGERQIYLRELVDSLLLKDILSYQKIKGSQVLYNLLKLLAFQVGSEVAVTNLGRELGMDKNTVLRYLDLLEKSYIIFNLRGYSGNLRKEVTRKSKYYFYDNGVRNALISNFNDPGNRDDMGKLWENFCIVERLKLRSYRPIYANQYFWRTWSKQEIDLVEEREGKLFGYEFKWNDKKADNVKVPTEWTQTYQQKAEFNVVSPNTLAEFLQIGN
jgi:predicted AAA+ superfamily ATPase